MTAAHREDPNVQILRALGITQKNIVAADISLRPGQPPRFTVDCLADPTTMLHEVLAFDLVPRPPEPRKALDLDALGAAARGRLTAEVQHSANMALADQYRESCAIRTRLDKATARHSSACVRALAQLEMACTLRPGLSLADVLAGGGIFAGSVGGLLGAGGLLR